MQIIYENNRVRKQCESLKEAKKFFPVKIAEKLHQTVNFIKEAANLTAIMNYKPYRFHDLKGDKEGVYSIDIGSIRDGYRMELSFKETKDEVFHNSIEILEVVVMKVGKHYE